MDSLTQIVLGAAVGEATLGKKVGNKAMLYGAIAGTIPDLDVLVGKLTDTVTAIEWHRGFSHSLLFCLLMAPLLGMLVNRIERQFDLGWKPWTKLFFWGLFTHPILDAFTSWGTQILWPIKTRFAFNAIFVIDPLYTLPFLGFTIAALCYKRGSKRRQKLNHLGLFISTAYLFFTLLIKWAAHHKFETALKEQQISFTEISTRPSAMNTILWNANVDTEAAYLIGDYSFFDTKPIRFKAYPKNRVEAEPMLSFPKVQRLMAISEDWYIIEKKEGQWIFNDLRFGLIPKRDGSSFFSFSYMLDPKDQNTMDVTEVPKSGRDAKFLMQHLWERIKGN